MAIPILTELGEILLKGRVRGYAKRTKRGTVQVRGYERRDRPQRSADDTELQQYYGDWQPRWRTPSPEEFVGLRDRSAHPEHLSPSSPRDLAHHTLIASNDGKIGVAVSPDGDMQNLFNNGGPGRAATEAIFAAIAAGARTLDCYDGFRVELYRQFGFLETGRVKFDPTHAPTKIANEGRPDVVFMRWGGFPDDPKTIRRRIHGQTAGWIRPERTNRFFSSWDEGKAHSRGNADVGADRSPQRLGLGTEARGVSSRRRPRDLGDLKKASASNDETLNRFVAEPEGQLVSKRAAHPSDRGSQERLGVDGSSRRPHPGRGPSDRRPLRKASLQADQSGRLFFRIQPETPSRSRITFDERGRIVLKADVQRPGSRGGHGFYNREGHWEYGYPPRDSGHPEPAPPRIAKVLKVIDTREYEEGQDGKFYPIPGSGTERECDRCKRPHEVHAHVELSDGTSAVVGTGCMGGGNAEVASRLKSATSAAKTLGRLKAERAKLVAQRERWDQAAREVEALPVPAATEHRSPSGVPIIRVDDGDVSGQAWVQDWDNRRGERLQDAIRFWRDAKVKKLSGLTVAPAADALADIDKRIARAEAKLR